VQTASILISAGARFQREGYGKVATGRMAAASSPSIRKSWAGGAAFAEDGNSVGSRRDGQAKPYRIVVRPDRLNELGVWNLQTGRKVPQRKKTNGLFATRFDSRTTVR